MRQLYFLLVFIICFTHEAFSQDLQFYREELTFEIKENYFYVDGFYNFCNNGEQIIKQILFYPFPIDSVYGKVDLIKASDANIRSSNLITTITDKGFYFNLSLQPYGFCKYRISYRQKLLDNKAEHILVTTQNWGKPLENASYKLIAPLDIEITTTSFEPDSVEQKTDCIFYYWNKNDFMPDKNMVFYFKRNNN